MKQSFLHRFFLAVLVAFVATGCDFVNNIIHDDEVVAKVGKHKLYKSVLEGYIPRGIPSEDSTRLSLQYINSWATQQLLLDEASLTLSKTESDVSQELEEYRSSLIRYKFEQKYIAGHLDTLVSQNEIKDYYESHPDLFKLDSPIAKARIIVIGKKALNYKDIMESIKSSDKDDLVVLDSLANISAFKYADHSQSWTTLLQLCREVDADYTDFSHRAASGSLVKVDGEANMETSMYFVSYVKAGAVAPLDYCSDNIKEIIISSRKRALITSLEQDLLDEARKNEKLKLY